MASSHFRGPQPSWRQELYLKASQLQERAQQIVDKVSEFQRFDKYKNLDLPRYQQPRLKIATTFELNGLDSVFASANPQYEEYANEVLIFLGSRWPDWQKLLNQEARIQARFRYFYFTIIATTEEQELMGLKHWMPEVITRPISDFTNERDFLANLGIARLEETLMSNEEWLEWAMGQIADG